MAHSRFGDEAVYVLVRGDLPRLVLTSDLNRLLGLEGCLSGNVPAGAVPPGGASGPCARIGAAKAVRVVYGPATFINSSVEELTKQLQGRTRERAAQADRAREAAVKLALSKGYSQAEAKQLGGQAEQLVYAQFAQELLSLNAKYGLNLTGAPKLNDPDFVYQLVFDPARGERTPKARFAYLFPSASSALISVRLKAGLSDAERAAAIAERARRGGDARLEARRRGSYVVTGVPVLADSLASELAGSTLRLLLVAVAVMALVLALLFRARLRLLPLLIALSSLAIVFGALSLLGLPLTMASIAVLPVLLGLAVDYAIQFQARVAAWRRSARRRWPPASASCSCCVSPVPMVRGFGALLVAGVVVAFVLAITAGTAVADAGRAAAGVRRRVRALGARRGGALRPRAPARGGACGRGGCCAWSPRGRARCWSLAVALAACGWLLDSRIGIESSLQRLVPQSLGAVRDLDALQRDTGVAGEVDVLVEGRDLTDPKVIAWMRDYQNAVLLRNGYSAEDGLRQGGAVSGALAARPVPHARALRHPRRRSARCWTPCRRTSRRRRSPPTAGPRCWPSGSGCSRSGGQRAVIAGHAVAAEAAAGRARDGGRAAGAGRGRQPRDERPAAAAADGAGRAGAGRCWRCSASTARGSGRGCRWCRSRWPPAGRRWCCGSSACR